MLGLACCLCWSWYGAWRSLESCAPAALSIKTLVMPEWWMLVPLPVGFVLLAIEFLFRMRRLRGASGPRDEAVTRVA